MRSVATALCDRPGVVGMASVEVPEVGPAEGLLRVEASGICGTDIGILDGRLGQGLFPLTLGHEIVGTIEALGDEACEAWGVGPGDRVFVQEFLPCRRCAACRAGHHALCPQTDFIRNPGALRYGATSATVSPSLWGGFAELLYLHPASLVHRIPADVPAEIATLLVPLANGLDWVGTSGRLGAGDTIAVIGPGQHGLGCVVAAVQGGAGRVVVVGLAQDAARLKVARRLGATQTVALEPGDDLLAALGEDAVDVVVDTTGAAGVVAALPRLVRPLGRVVLAAPVPAPLDAATVAGKALTVVGVRGRRSAAVEQAVDLLASGIHALDELCSHTFALADTGAALDVVRAGAAAGAVHVCVVPG